MLDFWQRQPPACLEAHLAPGEPLFVAAPAEAFVPPPGHFQAEASQGA